MASTEADLPTYSIIRWNDHYENNRTREMKNMGWVPIPCKLAGDGYTEIVAGTDGPAIYGAWVACVLLAASCKPRGTLLRSNGTPHTPETISRITRMPVKVIKKMLETAQSVDWIEVAGECGIPAGECGETAISGTEQNRTEGKNTARSGDRERGFEDWWLTYKSGMNGTPMRDKDKCLDVWKDKKLSEYAEALTAKLDDQIRFRQQKATENQFCLQLPDPVRYLKRKLWLEELE